MIDEFKTQRQQTKEIVTSWWHKPTPERQMHIFSLICKSAGLTTG